MTRRADAARLGGFRLQGLLGRGGMGAVYGGVHEEQGLQVAIKVVGAEHAANEYFVDAFGAEVRAVAGLDHPGIVVVYAVGTVDAAAAERTDLVEGSPWLAMELASGGTLADHPPAADWDQISATALGLLDALAHAHARGVIHRDLKPANVLIGTDRDLRPGLKLTDFGLAAATARFGDSDRTDSRELVGGTPRYMAPEQFQGRWRDQGPWTDLYSLGCICWELASGAPPFEANSFMALGLKHSRSPLPALAPVCDLPAGFEEWLRGLLAKDPGRRARRAADAASALIGLGSPGTITGSQLHRVLAPGGEWDTVERRIAPTRGRSSPTLDAIRIRSVLPPVTPRSGAPAPRGGMGAEGLAAPESMPPAIPVEHFATPRVPPRPVRLVGAGLGLHTLKPPPLVGRAQEQQALWDGLRAVRRDREPRVILLTGPAGAGKSRLASWLAWRAHELGAATVVSAGHAPVGGGTDGLRGLLGSALRCHGLEEDALRARLDALLPDEGPDAARRRGVLAEVLLGDEAGTVGDARDAVAWLFARLASERPLIVVLDDVQWGLDALGLVRALLASSVAAASPILWVLTRTEGLPGAFGVDAALAGLLTDERSIEHVIGPLEASSARALVGGLLALSPPAAAEVVERAGGNPRFAVALVSDWIARGVLRSTPSGFEPDLGTVGPALPEDLATVWSSRAGRILLELGRAASALEIAAILGGVVDARELDAAITHAGLPRAAGARARAHLVSEHLATVTPTGWVFTHPMLRAALIDRAEASGRGPAWHAAAAAALATARPTPRQDERLGRHLVSAGRPDEALPVLWRAATGRLRQERFGDARRLLADYRAAMDAVRGQGAPEALVAVGAVQAQVLEADLAAGSGGMSGAAELGRAAMRAAAALGEDGVLLHAIYVVAGAELSLGHFAPMEAPLDAAIALARTRGDERLTVLLRYRGIVGAHLGRLGEGRRFTEESLAAARAAGDLRAEASALRVLGDIAEMDADPGAAQALYERALDAFERCGRRSGQSRILNQLGELARGRGDLVAAAAHYRRSMDVGRTIGADFVGYAVCNLALVLILDGGWDAAWRVLHQGGAGIAGRRNPTIGLATALLMLAVHAHRGDWSLWTDQLAAAREHLRRCGGFRDPDLRLVLTIGVEELLRQEQPGRAAALRAFAASAE